MSFLNYRLADVRISPRGRPRRARHRVAPRRRQGHRLRRPADDVPRAVAGRPDPEGRRHDAGAADGGGRAAPVPRLGRPLPRQDGPVPRRRVEPRQVDGPDRGLPARRRCSSRPRRPSSTRRGVGRDGLEVAVPQEADRGHRARRQGRAGPRRGEVLRRRCRPGRSTPSRAPVDVVDRAGHRRQLRPVDGRDDPVRAAVPDVPLAPELLPAQRAAGARLPDADGRHRRAAVRPAPTSSSGSPQRPYFFIRAATPQVLLDEVDRVL